MKSTFSSLAPSLPTKLAPAAATWEAYRRRALRRFFTHAALLLGGMLLAAYLILFPALPSAADRACLLVFTTICSCVLAGWYFRRCNRRFIHWLKANALNDIFAGINELDLHWRGGRGHGQAQQAQDETVIPNRQLQQSDLFWNFNQREIDDEFWGTYQGIPFKISETCLKLYDGSYYRKYLPLIYFKGVIVAFQFPQKVLNRTLVASRNSSTQKNEIHPTGIFLAIIAGLGLLCCSVDLFSPPFQWMDKAIALFWTALWLAGLIESIMLYKKQNTPREPLDLVVLEDPYFNKIFKVYSSDQVEARYLVNPSFMERLLRFEKSFGGKQIKCSFFGHTFMIALPTKKNVFEIGNLFKPVDNPATLRNFYQELNTILGLIEHFKLNKFIFRHHSPTAKKQRPA